MREHIRKLITPSMRFEIRKFLIWTQDIMGRACLWRWEIARFRLQKSNDYEVLYVGRKSRREMAKLLIGGKPEAGTKPGNGAQQPGPASHRLLISEMPSAGALYVPHYLSAIIPLGRPLEEIIARYDGELRRSIRKCRPLYRMQQVLTDEAIGKADREMLQPYAQARHGLHAKQFDSQEVVRIAQTVGRLDLIMKGDEVVACHFGCVITRAGKRYWSTLRFGYPEAVFSDPKRLREVNSITTFMALEWAIEQGFDYYDIGQCLARPDDGLLKWKRRRGGDVDTLGNQAYMFVRLPKTGIAKFLWEFPLFAVEDSKLTLHLGLPDGPSDEEIVDRYREMVFGGLFKIYIYCAKAPGELLLENLRDRYAHFQSPPILERVASN
ncbi:conserved protein of unknown function [Pseudomonas sp. JV551A1]|uniref:Uncharacterized protein n=1 Tax=Pseudomonas inefficax TaxID=2078786 RepID=A0AAQ1PBD5_9PSED|nr:hypothetical protein [Pseudomonas]SPO54559.1 conserved protein of unknown function [Pseudomonas sp. JV551A1]SPO62161.1 conserved protein of unknown function [Pseudomonas inefficax]